MLKCWWDLLLLFSFLSPSWAYVVTPSCLPWFSVISKPQLFLHWREFLWGRCLKSSYVGNSIKIMQTWQLVQCKKWMCPMVVVTAIVGPRSVEHSKNANNSAVLHAINTGLVLIDCTQKCVFYIQNFASWKQGKVVKEKTPYIVNRIPFAFFTF